MSLMYVIMFSVPSSAANATGAIVNAANAISSTIAKTFFFFIAVYSAFCGFSRIL